MTKIRRYENPAYGSRFSSFVEEVASKGIPDEAVDIYRGRNRVVALPAPAPCGSERINIKEFRRPNFINRWAYAYIRRGKARRSFENARRLLDAGFITPPPIAWAECRGPAGRMELSYYISGQLDGWQEIREAEKAGHPRLDDIAAAIGALLYRLHNAGIWMKDSSPGNFLWREESSGEISLALVDINRMAFGVRRRKTLMSNFGRIFAGEGPTVAAARAYARAASIPEDEIVAVALEARRDEARKRQRKQALKRLFS